MYCLPCSEDVRTMWRGRLWNECLFLCRQVAQSIVHLHKLLTMLQVCVRLCLWTRLLFCWSQSLGFIHYELANKPKTVGFQLRNEDITACEAFLPQRLCHLREPFLIPLWYLYRVALILFHTFQGLSSFCSLPFLKSVPVSFLPLPPIQHTHSSHHKGPSRISEDVCPRLVRWLSRSTCLPWRPQLSPQDPQGRRADSMGCPLTSTRSLWHIHACTHRIKWNTYFSLKRKTGKQAWQNWVSISLTLFENNQSCPETYYYKTKPFKTKPLKHKGRAILSQCLEWVRAGSL